MKIQEDPTQLLDVPTTHLECHECCEIYDLETDAALVMSTSDVGCPNEEEGEDHPVELVHASDTPLASPSAVKQEVGGNVQWEGLDPFDTEHWHYGRRQFVYGLEDA